MIMEKEKKEIKARKTRAKLDFPVKVYFNQEDYEILNSIADKNGLDPAAFIRSRMKVMIEEEKEKLMFSTIAISRDDKTNEEKFNSIIIRLGFVVTQMQNTKDINKKDLLLNNIKTLFNEIVFIIKEEQKEQVKEQLYSILNYNIDIKDIINLDKLKKYLI